MFILPHSFGVLRKTMIDGPQCFGPVWRSTPWQKGVEGQNYLPHGQEVKEREGKSGNPKTQFRGMAPSDLRTFH
jgi:hypothetical protein